MLLVSYQLSSIFKYVYKLFSKNVSYYQKIIIQIYIYIQNNNNNKNEIHEICTNSYTIIKSYLNIYLNFYFILGKFYKTTNIIENSDSYGVLLDNSKLKTPFGNELVISSKALAVAVAEEWAMQKEHIKTDFMHLV